MRRPRRRRAAPRRESGSSREQLLKDLVTRGHEGPGHATAQVRNGAGPNLQPLGKLVKVSLAPDALRGRDSPLAPRPAPVQRRVVVGAGGECRVETLEGEDEAVALGVLERGPRPQATTQSTSGNAERRRWLTSHTGAAVLKSPWSSSPRVTAKRAARCAR